MSLYKPNDPVWVRSFGPPRDDVPAGEHAGVVIERAPDFVCTVLGQTFYAVNVLSVAGFVGCPETRLRPRRDDYQQHEPLGSRSDLDKPLADSTTEHTVILYA